MKINICKSKEPPTFTPVEITLNIEDEKEWNALFAVANMSDASIEKVWRESPINTSCEYIDYTLGLMYSQMRVFID